MKTTIDPSLTASLHAAPSASARVDALFDYLQRRGSSFYDESVTQLQHALQCAFLAQCGDGTAERITAALLHDLGHFLMDEHEEQSDFLHEDWRHETAGAACLAPFLSEAVTVPIRLHVPAKRYLCMTEPGYLNGLSQASQRSFRLQGGMMAAQEVAEFEQRPFWQSAVLLRRWDDGSKISGLEVPGLEYYRDVVGGCFAASHSIRMKPDADRCVPEALR